MKQLFQSPRSVGRPGGSPESHRRGGEKNHRSRTCLLGRIVLRTAAKPASMQPIAFLISCSSSFVLLPSKSRRPHREAARGSHASIGP